MGRSRHRKIIAKIEHTDKGSNPRYIVTNLAGEPQFLYDQRYCARGDMENRIKEQQLALFADRTSCHYWWANQFRLFADFRRQSRSVLLKWSYLFRL